MPGRWPTDRPEQPEPNSINAPPRKSTGLSEAHVGMRSIVLIVVLLISAPAGAQTWSESGLETANYKYVAVSVEALPAAARSIGLTKDRIQTRVELRLRSAGLTPGNDSTKNNTNLYVNINIVGGAFNVAVRYNRLVNFTTGNRVYSYTAATWNSASAGTHGGDAAFIMNWLDSLLDEFLNEYLKANQK